MPELKNGCLLLRESIMLKKDIKDENRLYKRDCLYEPRLLSPCG